MTAYRVTLLIIMAGTTTLYSLSMTLVNIVLPQLQGAMSSTQEQVSWVVTLNVLATAMATPLTGSLVSLFGSRIVLLVCTSIFTIATFACGLSTSLESLIFFRIIQGAAGAPLMPLCQATLLQNFPTQEHAKVNGIFGIAVVVGPAIAPSLGGYLAETYDWRWVFFIMVPLGLFAVLGNYKFLIDSGRQENTKFDFMGFILFSTAIVSLQLIIDRGEIEAWLESSKIIFLLVVAIASFYLYISTSFYVHQPYIKFKIFRNKNYFLGVILFFIYGSLNFTPLVLLPSMLQQLQDYPDTLVGWVLAARGCGMVVGFFIASRMGRLDPRVGMLFGMCLISSSGWAMSVFNFQTSFETITWASTIQGVGCGILWVPLTVITFSTMPKGLYPDASAFFHLLRNLGTSIFVGISIALLIRSATTNYSEITGYINEFEKRLIFPFVSGENSFNWGSDLTYLASEITEQSLMIAYNNVFFFYSMICLLTLPILSLITIRKT